MRTFLCVCLGGAAGTGARYLVALGALRLLGSGFPFGTLIVNVLGSFLLGLTVHIGLNTEWLSPTWRAALTTGVMGGFTTYSSFNHETLQLAHAGRLGWAFANLALTLALCLLAGAAGLLAGHILTTR